MKRRKREGHVAKEAASPQNNSDGGGVSSKTASPIAVLHDSEAIALAIGLWLGAVIIYRLTRYPGINGGDSGELLAAACAGGVAHPPGYPTYLMLANLFLRLPLMGSNPHQRITTMSSTLNATAAVLLMFAVRRMYSGWEHGPTPSIFRPANWAGFLAGGSFAFSPLVWEYSLQAEVFGLNNACMAAVLLCMAHFSAEPSLGTARLGAFLAGLALTNQHTMALFLVPAILYLIVGHRALLLRASVLGELFLWSLAGLSPYAYLSLAAARGAAYSWGEANSLRGFIVHLLRRDYGTFRLTSAESFSVRDSLGYRDTLHRMALYLLDFWRVQGFWLLLPAAGLGAVLAVSGARRRAPGASLHGMLWVAFGFYWVVFHLLANMRLDSPIGLAVQSRFWMQPNVILFAYAGLGTVRSAGAMGAPPPGRAGLAALLVAAQVGLNWRAMDRSRFVATENFGRGALSSLPPDATLLVNGENNYLPVLYLQRCEGLRPDVRIVSKQMMTYSWYARLAGAHFPGVVFPGEYLANPGHINPRAYSLGEFFMANVGRAPFYVLGGVKSNHLPKMLADPSLEGIGVVSWPEGLSEAVYNATAHPSPAAMAMLHQRAMEHVDLVPENLPWAEEGMWEYFAVESTFNALYRMSWRMLQHFILLQKPQGAPVVRPLKETQPWGTGEGGTGGNWGMGDVPGLPVNAEEQTAQSLSIAEDNLRFLEAVEAQKVADKGWVPWGPFDTSFKGYIYKHLGFIAMVANDKEGIRRYYTKFLREGNPKDPNRREVENMLRDM